VSDLTFDWSSYETVHPRRAVQSISIINGTDVEIEHVAALHGADGIFVLRSKRVRVTRSLFYDHSNASLDSWDGNEDLTFAFNDIDGNGGAYGILFTGLNETSAATTKHVRAIGNTIRNVSDNGIWVQGGQKPGEPAPPSWTGRVEDFQVIANAIENVTAYGGIRVSQASKGIVADNVVRNAKLGCIAVASEGVVGAAQQSDVVIWNNVCRDTVNGGGQPIIYVECLLVWNFRRRQHAQR
jgi:hypothetical protein